MNSFTVIAVSSILQTSN